MEPRFRPYRKITPTIARVLTEMDFDARGGVIQTNEGPASFLPGDSLARDAKGEWPIEVGNIRTNYKRTGFAETPGYALYQSLNIRYAAQMEEIFVVDGLTGKAGDYLVKSGNIAWPVAREIFESSYELAEEAIAQP